MFKTLWKSDLFYVIGIFKGLGRLDGILIPIIRVDKQTLSLLLDYKHYALGLKPNVLTSLLLDATVEGRGWTHDLLVGNLTKLPPRLPFSKDQL